MSDVVGRIAISEIYPAIQGEGPSVGRPSLFVRTSECNLSCVWCDTPFTWNWKKSDDLRVIDDRGVSLFCRKDEQIRIPIVEFIEQMNAELQKHGLSRVVLTGGEPLLWQKALRAHLENLNADWIEVETNGTIEPLPGFDYWIKQYNVSPKLSNSGDSREKRITPFLAFYAQSSKAIFKFVVCNDQDLLEVEALIREFVIPKEKIWLMGEGKTRVEQESKMRWAIETALERGWNVTPRLHVLAYDAKRKV
jgi:7-carboxy-7-deazaguanine synthase